MMVGWMAAAMAVPLVDLLELFGVAWLAEWSDATKAAQRAHKLAANWEIGLVGKTDDHMVARKVP